MVRACALPARVIRPRLSPRTAAMLGRHEPDIGDQLLGVVEAGKVTDFGDQRSGADPSDTAQNLQATHQRRRTPCPHRFGQRRFEAADPRPGFQNPLLELLERQFLVDKVDCSDKPAPVHLRPGCLATETTIMAEQEATHGLFGPNGVLLRATLGTDQVTYRFVLGIIEDAMTIQGCPSLVSNRCSP